MPELNTINVQRMYRGIAAKHLEAVRRGIEAAALAGERQAKINASAGAHRKNTPTPATRYVTGPARISGNLVRNITHDRVTRTGTVFVSKVGIAGGAPYGKWVEALGYEFIKPTYGFLEEIVVPIIRAEMKI